MMGKHPLANFLILLLNMGTLLSSFACPDCPHPSPSPPPPSKPPYVPKPPYTPTPTPPYTPTRTPPYVPKPPYSPSPNPPYTPKPPYSPAPKPPSVPQPPYTPTPKPPLPPVVPKPPPTEIPCPPPPPRVKPYPPPPAQTCPIDTLKLDACVDVLGGLIHIGIGSSPKDTCCPLLEGLADLDAALCLCTTIKAKLLNINLIIPIALEVLVDCGKHPPPGFQCPA